jgi:hypothetical protein
MMVAANFDDKAIQQSHTTIKKEFPFIFGF